MPNGERAGNKYLVGVFIPHLLDGEFDQFCGYALTPVGGLCGEHGYVASVRAAAVGFEFADYDAYEAVVFVECLCRSINTSVVCLTLVV